MLTLQKGTAPMKKVETKQLVLQIIMAFVFLMILLYASILLSGERVVTIPDGDSSWQMRIHPQGNSSAPTKQSPSEKLKVIPVQYTETLPPAPQNLSAVPAPTATQANTNANSKTVPETICHHSPAISSYEAIYRSIPFSRAEYLANPSYRHEATMEMMMGQLRPTVTHKTYRARVQGSFPAQIPYRTHYQLAPLDRSWYNRYPFFGGAIKY
ncbi:hypothetical protein MNBD_PLANCTO02-1069 [hydrothermal vent metagenome]|uniref:Uncharacterized protein n=1 Tax=hydrothermal vent metagenome TaxID=652676 RepID=A0A3B1DMM4_9ZZZZ